MSADAKILHRVIRQLAGWAVWSFFTEVHIIGEENVPRTGPLIVTATHHNMMLDPAVLSSAFPYKRIMNYWSKASLYGNPVVRYILLSTGNIPVDRKSKDRRVLFKGTFEALSTGQAVALFPEGTSYTEPRIMQVKDGAAWAALEYTKWAKEQGITGENQEVTVLPVAIVYTNKSKYRSDVVVEFGKPISMDAYKEQFYSEAEGEARLAVKRLTADIERELVEATINAPDWDTLYAARMARDLLWENNRSIGLDDFVTISQTIVDLFSTPEATSNFNSQKRRLLEYYALLQSTHMTNSVLSDLPLPPSLSPSQPISLPSRLRTLLFLIKDTLSSLTRLPFFLFPLIVHLPVYVMGRLAAKLVEDEEETQAQNKVVIGLLLLMLIYPAAFFFLWAMFWYTPVGALVAAGTVWLFAVYHNKMINDNYEHAKRFVATWRVLIGVWTPKRWELSMDALAQYTTPAVPPENTWVERKKAKADETTLHQNEPPVADATVNKRILGKNSKKPSTRRIMRHVLRARVEAAKALAAMFDDLQSNNTRLRASPHLAKTHGAVEGDQGWRSAGEVIQFLKERGAKIPRTSDLSSKEEAWARALSSDADLNASGREDEDDMVFVPRGQ